ncbi:hypothetical protein FOIG_04445 [Fusarium odoratissimum NRRL 54006]|uniref:Uncharacterized protein n=2 Tax=Fusarium oxysporum species complex TaxID=171631 RepID=X0KBP1_FUSO5|nr:uncharacterized protein FOIG_04445 [Fusarium odoratissimum NRRL 54006]EXM06051.1 hypothetical protein FOIG_04445 [Fusarium odoratissimum NRRL 54006]TXB99386.1 hypothetical protein FocTR4_00013992 [Fusarium oxysporum f. sp. cubense]
MANCQFLTTVTAIEPEWLRDWELPGGEMGDELSPISVTAVEPASGVLPWVYDKIKASSA